MKSMDSRAVVRKWIPMFKKLISGSTYKRTCWMPVEDAAKVVGLKPNALKAIVRRKSVRAGMAKAGIALAFRGSYIYAYQLDDTSTRERSNDVGTRTGVVAGEVRLVPGVLNRVASTSEPGTSHEVRLSKNGNVYCDCEGYAYRGFCSHIEATIKTVPMLKVLVVASIRNRIEHLKETLAKLDE